MKRPNILLEGMWALCTFILFIVFMASAAAVIGCVAGSVMVLVGSANMLPGFTVAFPLAIGAGAFVLGSVAGALLLKLQA